MSLSTTNVSSGSYISKGQAFNNWVVDVSKGGTTDFIVSKETDEIKAGSDFINLAKSYIKEYDTITVDGAISFDEFKAKEVAVAKENGFEIPDDKTLALIFDRLNIAKSNTGTEQLTEKEILTYFRAMDNLAKSDNKITAEEFITMAVSLQDTSTKKDSNGDLIVKYLKSTYRSLFGN